MIKQMKKYIVLILISLGLTFLFTNCSIEIYDEIDTSSNTTYVTTTESSSSSSSEIEDIIETEIDISEDETIDFDGVYTTAEDVALYIHTYDCLPSNFITKQEARSLGWEGGSLEQFAPGMCIGGDYFGNYENLLPSQSGREYHECDINTLGASSRGAERLIYSNDGLIYYTSDHYETFELLYGEE